VAVYVWKSPYNTGNRRIGVHDEDASPDWFIFRRGQRVSEDPGVGVIEFEMPCERIRTLDSLVNTSGSPVVSPRLAEILTAFAPDDIQLFDVLLKAPDGDVEGYKLVNITHTVEGVDRERSVLKLSPGDDWIRGFDILFCKPGCMDRHHLARLDEFSPNMLVSQALRDHLKRSRLRGLNLCLPEDWYASSLSDAARDEIRAKHRALGIAPDGSRLPPAPDNEGL
jgi:hypothetical protein